ncbi:hypothetical protein AB0O01_14410 [Streptomyces sp. NPDC093252]|uniref:SCO2102 family sporulation regulator n=1 Tax=Streptomyces sp. NPDC093252 TaxID=3154980 RepID=UPI0034366321
MGWTVLYIAFGIVALWLLGEVLLQYKARLRWRLLAFGGFLGVVVGVLIPSVVVIGLGAAAFAVGQTYVTLSFRRGFSAGWAVNGRGPGGSKRRRGEPEHQDPTLEVSDLQAAGAYGDFDRPRGDDDQGDDAYATGEHPAFPPPRDDYERDDVFTPARATAPAAEGASVYQPQPMPDDTGSYGVYDDTGSHATANQPQDQYAATAQGADQTYGYDGYTGYDQQQYGYDPGNQQPYPPYSDPYIGQAYGSGPGPGYDPGGYGQQGYDQQGYGQDQYGNGYPDATPPGGVWVPQQRTTDDPYGGELPPEQPYPYQGQDDGQQPQGNSYDDGYRF